MPAPARGDILRRIGDLLTERKSEMAFQMTREMGKPFFETKGDVQEAIDTAYYAATETRRMFGHSPPANPDCRDCYGEGKVPGAPTGYVSRSWTE